MARGIVAVLIGYVLGSFLPAYFIGRARGVDLRREGTGNPGTTNAYHVLGAGPAVLTAVYDLSKGVVAMGIAYLLAAPPVFVYLSGAAAVIGHHFPFYLGFRGGQGVGASVGLLLLYISVIVRNGWLPLIDFALLAGLVAALYVIFRQGSVIGPIVLPALAALVFYHSPDELMNWFFLAVVIHIAGVDLYLDIATKPKVRLKAETVESLKHMRVLLRPAAIAFPLLYLIWSRTTLLILIGSVSLIFIIVDLVRLTSARINVFVFKRLGSFFREKERHTFSTATLFLLSSFLVILLFEKPIATMAIVFLVFGDLFAKFTGLEHGRWHVFGKTLDGTLSYFASCLVFGFVWSQIVPLPAGLIVVGALAAALSELFPLGVNDNFVIPLIGAAAMRAVQMFFF